MTAYTGAGPCREQTGERTPTRPGVRPAPP